MLHTCLSDSEIQPHSRFRSRSQQAQPIPGEDLSPQVSENEPGSYSPGEMGRIMIQSASMDVTAIKFNMRVRNVRTLTEQKSEEFTLRGIRWWIRVSNYTDNREEKYLSVVLYSKDTDMPVDVQRRVLATFKLYSPVQSYSLNFEKEWKWNKPRSWGYPTYVPWSKLMDASNQYVVNGRALFEIYVEVSDPN